MAQHASSLAQIRFAAALSGHLDPVAAAEYVAAQCAESLGGATADFATLHFSLHHAHAAPAIVRAVRERLKPVNLIGCSGEWVLGGMMEMEGVPGISLSAAALPGTRIKCFTTGSLPTVRDNSADDLDALGAACGFGPDHRGTILLADPFSTASGALLPALSAARNKLGQARTTDSRPSPIVGGFASSAGKPGGNVLILNESIFNAGGVGVSFSGNVQIDSLVSQGCKPIGQPLVVTAGKGQMIAQLGGRPALAVLTEVLDSLDSNDRQKLRRGLFVGRAISEYKERFGRDDFLIRNVIGVEKAQEAVAVADIIRVGQTVQFHIRDAQTAHEDLMLLLDAQRLYDAPAGVLLFTCNGRGTRLFDKPHHDAAAIAAAFAPPISAPEAAKGGQAMPESSPTAPSVPLAGFFCAGEIGPVGDQVFVHGQTACAALFRPAQGIA